MWPVSGNGSTRATQGGCVGTEDLTKVGVGWGSPLLGWGASTGPPTFLIDLHPPRCTLGQRTPAVDRLCLGIPPGEVSPGDARVRGCLIVRPLVFYHVCAYLSL